MPRSAQIKIGGHFPVIATARKILVQICSGLEDISKCLTGSHNPVPVDGAENRMMRTITISQY